MLLFENSYNFLSPTVITHKFSGTKGANGSVLVNGSFDVNVWYSYNGDKNTAVTTKNFTYSDTMNIPLKENHNLSDASEIMVRCLHQPTVANVNVDGATVKLDIEKEMGVEIVGDTKVKVSVEEDEDDYEEIFDEADNPELDEINEDYLNEASNWCFLRVNKKKLTCTINYDKLFVA